LRYSDIAAAGSFFCAADLMKCTSRAPRAWPSNAMKSRIWRGRGRGARILTACVLMTASAGATSTRLCAVVRPAPPESIIASMDVNIFVSSPLTTA